MLKMTGADFNRFMVDASVWLPDYWYDDAYFEVNGIPDDMEYSFVDEDKLAPDAKVTITGGALYHGAEINAPFYELEATARKWLKKQKVTTVIVEVPNEYIELFNSWVGCRQGFKILA